jgi:cysteine-rich repeat protein
MFLRPPLLVSRLSSHPRTRGVLFALGVVSLLLACTVTPKVKEEKLCAAGDYVYCRCRNREEGSKLCNEDGQSFGPCEPCESIDNPEGPLEPGDPGFDKDGGVDASDERPSEPSASCGNGIVESGEDCDDKNANDTDGCDTNCKLAGITPPATNSCPGLEVHVWGGGHKPTLVTKTTGSGNRSATPNCTGGPNPTSGSRGPDRIFKVIAHKSGMMTVKTSDADYDSFLYVSDACAADENTWLVCANESAAAEGESMTFPVDAGKTYYVFVDGAGYGNTNAPAFEGTNRVTFSIP